MTIATVQTVPDGAMLFDTDSVVSAVTAMAFEVKGWHGCLRYLSLSTPQRAGDLSAAELEGLLAAGLGVMAVQHVREPGWAPCAELGVLDGRAAAANAASLALPAGICIWLDLEGVNALSAAAAVIAHCAAWSGAVAGVGYVPGIYVGADCGLTGDELYSALPFKHYWMSASEVPDLPERGYQMIQSLVPNAVNGIAIDHNVVHSDSLGGLPLWAVASSPANN